MRVAINGFGRIGRMLLRAYAESSKKMPWQIVAINDLFSVEKCVHLLRYDSVHGGFPHISCSEGQIYIKDLPPIDFISERDPQKLPWSEKKIDLVLECTGFLTSHEKSSQHISAGATRVLVSAPVGDADCTVVYGVNHHQLRPEHRIISNASCTTNCLAPLVRVLQDSWGIISGYMTTVHAVTGDQRIIDASHSDPRRGRSGFSSMIPSTTGAAKALSLVIPEIKGKLAGSAVRVPVHNVSMVDLSVQLSKPTDADGIIAAMEHARDSSMKGVLDVTHDPVVSCDINHNPHSSIYDSFGTTVLNDGYFAHIMAWYDNEWGFSNRMLDVTTYLTTKHVS